MARVFSLLLCLSTCLITRQIHAGNPPVSLDECFQSALKQSEVMADQEELVQQAQAQAMAAWGGLLPTLSGYGSYFRQDQPSNLANPSGNPPSQGQVNAIATFNLFRGFRDFAAIKQAGASIKYQEESRRWAGLQLYGDVAQAYFAVAAYRGDLDHLDKEVEFYGTRVQELQERVRIGRSRPTDILMTQSALGILIAQRELVLGQLKASREVFAFLTGLPPETEPLDPGDFSSGLEAMGDLVKQTADRPDLKAASRRLEAAKAAAQAAWGGHLPSVDVTADYYQQRPQSSPWPAWDAQIALTLPIFSGFAVAAQASQADSQARQAELALKRLSRADIQEVRTLRENLESDLKQLGALKEAFEVSEKNYRAVKGDYNNGLITNLDVLTALSSWQDTGRAMDKARFQAFTDYHRLLASTARIPEFLKGD